MSKVHDLQETLSQAAKQSLDRRFGALYDKVYRLDVLLKSWHLVYGNGGGPGVDEEALDYILNEIGVEVFLGQLRDELRSGTYRPLPVKRVWIESC